MCSKFVKSIPIDIYLFLGIQQIIPIIWDQSACNQSHNAFYIKIYPACPDADSLSKNPKICEMSAATFYLRAHSPPGAYLALRKDASVSTQICEIKI